MTEDRYISQTFSELQEVNQTPIFGYENASLLPLKEALKTIIDNNSNLIHYVEQATEKCNSSSDLLTRDESAAIYLYSIPSTFFSQLNSILRSENRTALEPWFPFLKLFITALKKLPSIKGTVWRGINIDDTLSFVDDDIHIWWSFNSCSTSVSAVRSFLGDQGTLFAINVINGRDISEFSSIPDEHEVILLPGFRVRRKCESFNWNDKLFLLHLEEDNCQLESQLEANYLIETLKQSYLRYSRIECLMNPAKSFQIDKSYINLAMVTVKEQYKKEQQLKSTCENENILNSYEEIYGSKTPVEINDIFQSCKGKMKQILVFGRAGIGKTTFCRYITYQWAKGLLWPDYTLVALIPLRRLTENRYPSDKQYTLIDLVKKEVFSYELSEKGEMIFNNQFDEKKILWILDGYDEIVQNIPKYLEYLLEQLLRTPHHILTSRPYLNTLLYDVKMEIIGFTDENIIKYIQQFFDQLKNDEIDDALLKGQKLSKYLKSNRSIWGIAHIPVNLELICSLWSTDDWSTATNELTITSLYTMITTWLCRRYLTSQNIPIEHLLENNVYQHCRMEITFLENIAFNAMKSNTIIIRPSLLKTALNEAKISSKEYSHVLNIGILKSFQKQGVGTRIEVEKDYYFIHLSFQEYFAARYIINAIQGPSPENMIEFIKYQKYNQRYVLVFIFIVGLLGESDETTHLSKFWDTISKEPMDLVGLRHIELIIFSLEESSRKLDFVRRQVIFERIANCIKNNLLAKNKIILEHLSQSLRMTQSVICEAIVIDMLVTLLESNQIDIKLEVLLFICSLSISNAPIRLIDVITTLLTDSNSKVISYACEAIRTMGEKAVTAKIVNRLLRLLEHKATDVASGASYTIVHIDIDTNRILITPEVIDYFVNKLGNNNFFNGNTYMRFVLDNLMNKISTDEILMQLLNALQGPTESYRHNIYDFLMNKIDRLITAETINKLGNLLEDEREDVRSHACRILAGIIGKVQNIEVINQLMNRVLEDNIAWVRFFACSALQNVSDEIMTTQVLTKLLDTLQGTNAELRVRACFALNQLCQKVATEQVINALKYAKQDEYEDVRRIAHRILVKLRVESEISEMVDRILNALRDIDETIRADACSAISEIIGKAPTAEVLNMIENALKDKSRKVRYNACINLSSIYDRVAIVKIADTLISLTEDEDERIKVEACKTIGRIGETATSEIIRKIVNLLKDESAMVRAAACSTLEQMGEHVVTTEVIKEVVSTLKDKDAYVRDKACQLLERWIGKGKVTIRAAADNLVCALTDESENVRRSACRALEKMIKQVFKNDIISMLMNAMRDTREYVRGEACFLLGQMEENIATIEVINTLINTLNDKSLSVRRVAFGALKNLSDKVIPIRVIDNIVNALAGNDCGLKVSAKDFLVKINDKIATGDLISKLIVLMYEDDRVTSRDVAELIGNNLKSSRLISELGARNILKLSLSKFASICLKNISEEQLIQLFLHDKISDWPSAIAKLTVVRKTAVTMTKEKIVLYGSTEPIELSISALESQQLVRAFNDQAESLHIILQATS